MPEWEGLSEKDKLRWDDKISVYAAMIDRMDQNGQFASYQGINASLAVIGNMKTSKRFIKTLRY